MTVYDLSNFYTVLQKTNSVHNIIWQSAYALRTFIKCLEIDATEQSLYIVFLMNPTVIVKSDTSTGAFNSAIQM